MNLSSSTISYNQYIHVSYLLLRVKETQGSSWFRGSWEVPSRIWEVPSIILSMENWSGKAVVRLDIPLHSYKYMYFDFDHRYWSAGSSFIKGNWLIAIHGTLWFSWVKLPKSCAMMGFWGSAQGSRRRIAWHCRLPLVEWFPKIFPSFQTNERLWDFLEVSAKVWVFLCMLFGPLFGQFSLPWFRVTTLDSPNGPGIDTNHATVTNLIRGLPRRKMGIYLGRDPKPRWKWPSAWHQICRTWIDSFDTHLAMLARGDIPRHIKINRNII